MKFSTAGSIHFVVVLLNHFKPEKPNLALQAPEQDVKHKALTSLSAFILQKHSYNHTYACCQSIPKKKKNLNLQWLSSCKITFELQHPVCFFPSNLAPVY